MPDLSDTLRKCRIGTAKKFTLLLLLYHTQAKASEESSSGTTAGAENRERKNSVE